MSVETYNIEVYGVSFNSLPNLPLWAEPADDHLPTVRAFLRANAEALSIPAADLEAATVDDDALYDLVENFEHDGCADDIGSLVAAALDARLRSTDEGKGLVGAHRTDADMLVGIGILRHYPWERDDVPTMTDEGREAFEDKLREVLEELGVPSGSIAIEEHFDVLTC